MQIWYYETSAVNFLQAQAGLGTLATRNLQLEKGRDWRLSPTTIWEILLTRDPARREVLIDYCQHLFSRNLLPPPDELIVGFIKSGMPKIEPMRKLESDTHLAIAWSEVVDDKCRSLKYDETQLLEKGRFLKQFAKNIYRVVKDEDLILAPDLVYAKFDITLKGLVLEAEKQRGRSNLEEEELRFHKIALFYAILVLCSEAEMESHACKEYWANLGRNTVQERVEYIVYQIPQIIWRGPFVLMAYMTLSQTMDKFSRGLWFDCLHSVYITYVDMFFTNDQHFQVLREKIPDARLRGRINHMSEVEITYHKRNWLGQSDI